MMIATGIVNLAVLLLALLKNSANCCTKPKNDDVKDLQAALHKEDVWYQDEEYWKQEVHYKRLSKTIDEPPIKKRKIDNLDELVHAPLEDVRPSYGTHEISNPIKVVKKIGFRE